MYGIQQQNLRMARRSSVVCLPACASVESIADAAQA